MHAYRTHTCGALRLSDAGRQVRLAGWVHRKRDHGQLLFIDLRDHYGITQCVIDSSSPLFPAADAQRLESVISVTGTVVKRSPETINPKLPTGEVELQIAELTVLSEAEPLPFPVNAEAEYPEEMRLKYRFLDLRRDSIHKNIMLRSHVIASLRRRMIEQGFAEYQTPILTASSPEGARDYLVPSRLHPGKFYALPQAPQQFKQLLMVAGFDRYFQIAPCFRDEDARADRSPGEFYQLDIEMAFVTREEIFTAIEPVLYEVFREFSDWEVTPAPFPRIPYAEAMLKYGTDKPDLRNPLEIVDVTEIFRADPPAPFATAIGEGGVIRAIRVPRAGGESRKFFDRLTEVAQGAGGRGVGYIIPADPPKGSLAKHLGPQVLETLRQEIGAKPEDAVLFIADQPARAATIAGLVRTKAAELLNLLEPNAYRFCWIVDYPFYERDDEGNIAFSHNPFSMPIGGLQSLETKNPLDVLADQYDIVCNGIELSSGAVRNHRPDIMLKAFEIAGYSADTVKERFGAMLNAFRFGAPVHGGLAPGVDRIVMLLASEPNIREVIPFPLNQHGQDLMMNAPNTVTEKQLRELHITVTPEDTEA
ncbi:MAG TPA: aspartate--tRNA ligase [Burkholderiales bacterium]|nr:aspartate--tRNA ligase [Burkholderiales bacterium]